MQPGERRVALPCVLHLPDRGSARVTCNVPGAKLDYDARRFISPPFVRIAFPPATREHPLVEYELEVTAIYPPLPGIEKDARFDGFRRSFLNIFQINPRLQMLANNASSDVVPFTVFKYSEVALRAPPLAKGLTCLDLVRMTLDRYLAGTKGYGLPGYGKVTEGADLIPWPTPYTTSNTYPSLLIAAGNYVNGAKDWKWARANYAKLADWAREMMATDRDGHGLIEYPASGNYGDRPTAERRPSNWWDTSISATKTPTPTRWRIGPAGCSRTWRATSGIKKMRNCFPARRSGYAPLTCRRLESGDRHSRRLAQRGREIARLLVHVRQRRGHHLRAGGRQGRPRHYGQPGAQDGAGGLHQFLSRFAGQSRAGPQGRLCLPRYATGSPRRAVVGGRLGRVPVL